MASEATIAMTLVAQTAAFDRKMKRSSKRIDHMSRRARANAASLKRMATAAKGVVTAYAGLAGIRIVARGFFNAGKRAEDFNQAMMSSLAIMGDVSKMMRQDMKEAAFDVASSTKFASKQIAESYFFLASAGLKAEAQIAALPLVAKFAQAGMFDMRLATDLLTDAQSALGLTVKDAQENLLNMTRVSDVLVRANTLANASVQQFSEALTKKAAAASKFFGIELEQTVAVLAAFADQGLKASDAGTAFNIVMRELTTKSQTNAKAFRDAGVQVFDYQGKVRDLSLVIRDLENAMAGLAPRQRKMLLMQLGFQDKSSVFIQTLIGMSDSIAEYTEELRKAQGATEEVSKKQLTNLTKQLNITEGAWTEMTTKMDLGNKAARGVQEFNIAMMAFGEATQLASRVWGSLKIQMGFYPKAVQTAADKQEKLNTAIRKGLDGLTAYKTAVREMTAEERTHAELVQEMADKSDKFIAKLEKQTEVFGMSERQLAIYRLTSFNARDSVKALALAFFDQRDAITAAKMAMDDAERSTKQFADLFDELKASVDDFHLTAIEKEISALLRSSTVPISDSMISQIRIVAQALDDLKQKASAFDTLKSKALGLFKATRTPLEKYNEEIALLAKMAKTIDPDTGKALIDTDTLNRGLKTALDNLNALKRGARADSFISGQKREFVRTFGVEEFATNAARNANSTFVTKGGRQPHRQGGQLGTATAPGGSPAQIRAAALASDKNSPQQGATLQVLSRIEEMVRSALTRTAKTRVN